GNVRRARLPPGDRRTCGRGLRGYLGSNRQHARIQIEAHNVAASTNSRRGEASNYTRAARDVQYALAGLRVGQCDDRGGPWREYPSAGEIESPATLQPLAKKKPRTAGVGPTICCPSAVIVGIPPRCSRTLAFSSIGSCGFTSSA